MKNSNIYFLLVFLLQATLLHGQQDEMKEYIYIDYQNISKIIIADHQDYRSEGYYGSVYELIPDGDKYMLYRLDQYYELDTVAVFQDVDLIISDERIFIKEVDKRSVRKLIDAVNTPAEVLQTQRFGFTPSFLEENKHKIWEENILRNISGNDSFTAKERELCYQFITDTAKVSTALAKAYSAYWQYDHPQVSVKFISGNDTVAIQTDEQEPYMLPWHIGKRKSFDPEISRALADILPPLLYSNHGRLSGQGLEDEVGVQLYEAFCKPAIDSRRLRAKYISHFTALEKGFNILSYSFGSGSDIDLKGKFLAMEMKPQEGQQNIYWNVKFSQDAKSVTPAAAFLEKEGGLNDIFRESWLFDKLKQRPEWRAELYFADTASVTGRVVQFFRNDARSFIERHKLTQSIQQGLLVKIEEGKGIYSRWIILPDGRTILWHFAGNISILPVTQEPASRKLVVVAKFADMAGVK